MRRNLKKIGLTACIPRHKLAMTEAHCQACLEWESTFTQFQQGHQRMVWREPEEELNPDCISVTVKHSPSKMFWGCFS